MNDKYVIAWGASPIEQPLTIIYFKELWFKSHDYDTYGSSPEPTVVRTGLLNEAKVFDTIKEADVFFHKINEHIKVESPDDISFVKPVSEKEIFSAKLKDE